jgi:gluconate 5-dehydrogenase
MNIDLKRFHAVITGGSNGLGFEMSKALLSHGATVAIAARKGERLSKAYEALKSEGFDVHALEMDVRSVDSVDLAAKWIAENWERLDMLVNNAGLSMSRIGNTQAIDPIPFFEIQPDAFYDMIETNLIGYFLAARAFVPLMIKSGGGRLVNVATGAMTMVMRGMLPYGPSRAGSEAMSVIMSKELEEYKIWVNSLAPGGPVDTGFVTDEIRARSTTRLLPPDIMNEAILFLASDKSAGITGDKITATEFHKWLEDKGITT